MKEFFRQFWKKKNQWQLWFRVLVLVPILIPFVVIADIGRKSDKLVSYIDNNAPKVK